MDALMCVSKYVEHLTNALMEHVYRKRFIRWVPVLSNLPRDLYIPVQHCQLSDLPDVYYHNIYDYFVNWLSCYMGKSLKANKTFQAYNYLTSRWIAGIQIWRVPNKACYLITSKALDMSLCY